MNKSILVVEDDPSLVRSIVRNLSARGYSSRTAGTVDGAVSILQEELPSLVLLDIDLPGGSGWEVLRVLRSITGVPVPVVVMSALRPNARLVRELTCLGVLEKPFPMESLLRLIHDQLGDDVRNVPAAPNIGPLARDQL